MIPKGEKEKFNLEIYCVIKEFGYLKQGQTISIFVVQIMRYSKPGIVL